MFSSSFFLMRWGEREREQGGDSGEREQESKQAGREREIHV